jgi:hypothetical protein
MLILDWIDIFDKFLKLKILIMAFKLQFNFPKMIYLKHIKFIATFEKCC